MQSSQLAINSVSTEQDEFEQMLAAYTDAGFTNIEFQLGEVWDYLKSEKREEIQRLLDKYKLNCIGGFEGVATCFGPGDSITERNQHLIENAELLDDLGAETLVVGTDGPDKQTNDIAIIDHYADRFATLANAISHTSIMLCIEFNWSPVIKSLRTAAAIARRTGTDAVGVLFDPAHYHCTPTKMTELSAENVAQIGHVHVDDMVDKPGELCDCNTDRALPGEGHLDLKTLFSAIESHGYEGYFSIEMFDERLWSQPTAQAATQLYDSLIPLCENT
jgi:4-hydroxyphenylpyruvate dioxygenase